jgi:hypothetical protein
VLFAAGLFAMMMLGQLIHIWRVLRRGHLPRALLLPGAARDTHPVAFYGYVVGSLFVSGLYAALAFALLNSSAP